MGEGVHMKKKKKLFQYTVGELKTLLDTALSIDDSSDYAIDRALKGHSTAHNERAILAAQAQKLLHLAELDLKRTTAEVIRDIRTEAIDSGKPLAATYNVERELCPLNERWQDASRKVINLREYVDILSGIERRFNNRAWILINLAKGREGSFEPSVKGRKRDKNTPIKMEEYEL
jgi:hypothetical protein